MNNRKIYNNEMSKSIDDKAFFLKYLNSIDNLVDFGCANGELLKKIRQHNKNIKLYGIDNSLEEINEAKENVRTAEFIHGSKPIVNGIDYSKSGLILSSVVHEIYNYLNNDEIDTFWSYIKYSGYKYIFLRDMMYFYGDEKTDINIIEKIRKCNKYTKKLEEFEKRWGSIYELRNALHFLLKYRYDTNWDREVNENYMIIGLKEIENRVSKEYDVIYKEEYILPFTRDIIKKDFKVEVCKNTHIKLVLERKD